MASKQKRRSKGIITHARLIEHGLRLASEIGFAGVSIGPLAAEAGLKKSSFFAHFPTKEALQISLLEAAASKFTDVVLIPAGTAPPGIERVRRVFNLCLDWTTRAGLSGDPFIAASAEFDDIHGPVRDRLVGLQRVWVQSLSSYVQEAVDTGELDEDTDAQQFAFDTVGIFLAFHWAGRLLGDPGAERRAKASFERLVTAPPLRATRKRAEKAAAKAARKRTRGGKR